MSSDTACGTRSEQLKGPLRVLLRGPPTSNYITASSPFFLHPTSLQARFNFHSSQLSYLADLLARPADANPTSPYINKQDFSSSTPSSSETMSGSKTAAAPAQDTRMKSVLEQGAVKFVIKTKDQKWQCTLLDRATQ